MKPIPFFVLHFYDIFWQIFGGAPQLYYSSVPIFYLEQRGPL